MNKDPNAGKVGLSKMLQIDYFETNFNIIDRGTLTSDGENNDITTSGTCKCLDGTELVFSSCHGLKCHGGTVNGDVNSAQCNENFVELSKIKEGFCTTKVNGTSQTVELAQIFDTINELTPTRSTEGGSITIADSYLDIDTKFEWKTFNAKSVMKHATKLGKFNFVADDNECQKRCEEDGSCLGIQQDYATGCKCCLFFGTVVMKDKPKETVSYYY